MNDEKYTQAQSYLQTDMRDKLREPFPDEAYAAHSSKSFLTTIKAMYIIERLNDVFGLGRWTLEHDQPLEENGYVLIRGTLRLLDFPGVTVPTQYGGHKTTGTGTERADGYKSAITDCITKSASYLEIGIDVFKGKVKPPKSPQSKEIKPKEQTTQQDKKEKPWLNPGTREWTNAIKALVGGKMIFDIENHYRITKVNKEKLITEAL